MLHVGENFKGGRTHVMCPLCKLHLDKQELSCQCPAVKSEVEITGKKEDIYKEDIQPETARNIQKIMDLRELRKRQ